ncbi:interferon-induced transmembrane protein 1 [Carassius auratus]|uniref:Interferon-induced transmembrane protein 1 n=1 Tax=Carassius auratus TaxID=7957 RepID=A0A6P6K805_CARAU|nr:dispanin subfamily A member 2b-like [Carassius auratus]XP_052412840.1 interferon-induced transmembrane protein 1 [Carassius gibelio]
MAMQNYPAPGESMKQDGRDFTAQPVVLSMPDQKVNDDIIFSTFNLHFCNPCCLGFGAFYNSIKARDIRLLGDIPMARSYASRARKLNIAAAIIGSLSLLILIIVISKSFGSVTSSVHRY